MARISSNEHINDSLSPQKKKRGGKGVIIGGCTALVAVVAVVITVAAMNGNSSKPSNSSSKNQIVTPDNVEEVLKSMEEKKVDTGSYNVRMNPTWTFESGDAISTDAYVENAPTNNNDVRFTVEIKDTAELIYSSPVIPLGSRLANITLDKALPAGSYECIITYHLLDENGEDSSSVKLNLNIKVNN